MSTSVPDTMLKRYQTVQRSFEEAKTAPFLQRSLRAHRDLLRLNFARNMSALAALKGNPKEEAQRLNLIEDNKIVLRMLSDMRVKHPEVFDAPVKQESFLKELLN